MNAIDKLRQVARNNGWEFVNDYSGRYMFGRKCVGIVGPSSGEILQAVLLDSVTVAFFTGWREDTMAFEVIVYWPDIAAEEVTDETN
jgi:hypothetical protein